MSARFALDELVVRTVRHHLSLSAQPAAARCFWAHCSRRRGALGSGAGLASRRLHNPCQGGGVDMDRILATHTGSLIRPPDLLAFLAAKERGQEYDQEAYQKCLRESVIDVVRKQVQVGHRRRRRRRDGQGQLDHLPVRAGQRPRGPANPVRGREHAPAKPRSSGVSGRVCRARRARRSRRPREQRRRVHRAARRGSHGVRRRRGVGVHRPPDTTTATRSTATSRTSRPRCPSTRASRDSSRWWRRRAPTGSRTSTTPARRSSCSRSRTRSTRSTRGSSRPA